MAPMLLSRMQSRGDRPRTRKSRGPDDLTNLASLEANSHRPEAQALIRVAIRLGKIRVLPIRGCPDRVEVVLMPASKRAENLGNPD